MNHIYRLVWNKKRRMLMAVAEVGSTNGKETGTDAGARAVRTETSSTFPGALTVLAAAALSLSSMAALAQPMVTEIRPWEYRALSDSDGSNAEAAGWRLRNDGWLDIGATDAGTSLESLSGSGGIMLGERTLTLTDANDLFAGSMHGTGGLVLSGGSEILGGVNSYFGATEIRMDSKLSLSGSGSIALSSGVLNNGQFDISATHAGASIRSLAGDGSGSVLLGGRTLVLSAAQGEYAGSIDGAGGLSVTGGREVLSGANGYTGATTVARDATLALSGLGSIAESSVVTANGNLDLHAQDGATELRALSGSGAVLLGDGPLALTGNGSDFKGTIFGQGGLTVDHGTHVLGGATYYAGATSIGADGTLALSGSGSIALSSGVENHGVFDIAATNNGAVVRTISGAGAVQLGGKTLTLTDAQGAFDGSIHGSGGLAIGGGYTTLTAQQHYTGKTDVAQWAGLTLTGQASIAASSEVAVGGTLDLAGLDADATLQSLSGSGAVLLGDKALTLTDGKSRFDGSLWSSSGLTAAGGTQTLGGINQYTGATLIEEGAGLALAGSGSIAVSSGVVANGSFDIARATNGAEISTLSGSGAVLLGGKTLTLTNASGNFAGSIQGSGGLVIAGGHEVLSGANTYSGDTVVEQGARLTLEGAGDLAYSRLVLNRNNVSIAATDDGAAIKSLAGSGGIILGDKTLTITGAGDTYTGNIRGSGGLVIAGGTQVLNSHLSVFSGATAIDSGATLGLAGAGSGGLAVSSGVLVNGTLDIAAMDQGAQIKTLSGAGAVNLGGRTLTLTNASGNFAGSIRGTGDLELDAGRQVLSGRNTYSGDTRVASGATLVLAGQGSIANSRVTGNGTLDISGSDAAATIKSLAGAGAVVLGAKTLILSNAGDIFAGSIDGAGGLTVAGGKAVLAGDIRYTGRTSIGAGATLALLDTASLARSSGVVADGTFDVSAADSARIKTLSGNGAVRLGSNTLVLTQAAGNFAGVISGVGGLSVTAGKETLSGVNTYRGRTVVADGATLALAGKGSIADSRVEVDGVLDIASSSGKAAIKSLLGDGTVRLGSQTLTLTEAADTFGGTIGGAGGLELAGGKQTLTAAQDYTGATKIAEGASLVVAGKGAIAASALDVDGVFDVSGADSARIKSLSGNGDVQLGSNTLVLTQAGGNFAGSIGGAGGLSVMAGSETLSGVNTYIGRTLVATGATLALAGKGSIANSRLEVDGSFDIAAGSGKIALKSLTGAGTVRLGSQTLSLAEAADTFGGTIGGAGGLELAGGKLTLTTAQEYTGATDIAKGASLVLAGKAGIANSALGVYGVFDIAGAAGAVSVADLHGAGSVLLGANTLAVTRASGAFDGTLAGSGGLNLNGGTLALKGDNTHTGKTVVSNATLRTDAAANLGRGRSALELRDATWQTGASLDHDRGLLLAGVGTLDVAAATTLRETGTVSGSGMLVKQGAGSAVLDGLLANGGGLQVTGGTLALGADNTYTGDTTIGSGATLRIARDANLGAAGNGLVLDGGRLHTTGSLDSARAIEVTANNGQISTDGADSVITLDGNISGAGRIVKDGAGTLVLGGDNAGGRLDANRPGDGWTGGLTINSGLVKVTNSWGLGWGSVMTFNAGTIHATVDILTGQDIKMGRQTDFDVDAGTTTSLTGDLVSTGSGDGCFTKTGLGTLNVLGAARIDATCVLEGKLLANGVFASKVTVAKGATLGGAGTVQGDVVVHGTLSPGNSPGMLSADANITMAAGSTYKQDIGGAVQASANTPVGAAGHYSFLHVVNGKRFTIEAGATLAPALANLYTPGQAGYGSAAFVPELGQNFRILTAQGGIDGRFDTLAQPQGLAPNTRLAAFYDYGGNDSIELKVLPASYAAWAHEDGGNAQAVGAALDRIVDLDQAGKGSATQTTLSYETGSRNAQQLGGVLQGLAGEVHGALAAALPQAGWELQRTLLQRADSQDGRALWIDLGAGRAKWKDGDVASGFDADRVQVTVGFDLLQGPGMRLGFGASHASTDLDAQAGSGKLRQNKVFAYGEAAAGSVKFDLQGAYGRDKTESRRADPLDGSAGLATRGAGKSALLGFGASLPKPMGDATLAPFARVTLQRVERDALLEASTSAAALALDDWSATGTRVVAGLAGASRNLDPLQASTWRFKVGAGVDGGELLRPELTATLAGARFGIGAPDVGRGFVEGSVTGTVQLKKGAYLYFGVNGEARSDYRTVGGNAGLRGVF